jgi:tetratricopeptide (TPR) repeat protein
MTAYVGHDYEGALSAFRQAAAASEADRAEATLYIGFTLSARNDVDGALNAFRDAARMSASGNDHLNHVRALQAIGNRLEASGRWADAQTAWEEFVAFASAHPDVGNAANGRARINAIHQRSELDHQYEVVRQRIEERRRLNAQGPRPQS